MEFAKINEFKVLSANGADMNDLGIPLHMKRTGEGPLKAVENFAKKPGGFAR